ncbi:MAG: hypothetical protein FWG47_01720, partial [Propionibacteriaceae bacterium]|nr:hypothetical protein [Propionibacteriaceae bacterium]
AKTVINTAKRLLRGGGALCFEHDARNAEATRALLHASQAFTTAESHLDLTGRPRFVCAIRNDQPGHRCEESVPKVRK